MGPAVLVLVTAVVTRLRTLRPDRLVRDLGRTSLATFAVLELGIFATYPAGLPLVDEFVGTGSVWLPVVLLMILCVIAIACGIHPRAGADIAAMALLVVLVVLGGFETPCGPGWLSMLLVAFAFAGGAGGATVLRRMFRV